MPTQPYSFDLSTRCPDFNPVAIVTRYLIIAPGTNHSATQEEVQLLTKSVFYVTLARCALN